MYDLKSVICSLIDYAERNLGLDTRDEIYKRNELCETIGTPCFDAGDVERDGAYELPDVLLGRLVECCKAERLVEDGGEEALKDKVMGALSLLPSAVSDRFDGILQGRGGKAATEWLYGYSVKSDYVKKSVLDKNPRFDVDNVTVTINKAKPEFRDAKKAASGNSIAGGYPKCTICRENENFGGRNKRTLRTVGIKLGGHDWFWQFSPYGYFYQHGIAVNSEHIPMHVDKQTFYNLMDFVDMFPHFFIGSNAALPRIGGSVLAHDHYQGGGEVLPLQRAGIRRRLRDKEFPNVKIGIVDWQGTVVRVETDNRDDMAAVCDKIRAAWVSYSNPALGIICEDGDGIHNAISPTVIKTAHGYEMNIILRSNITSEEFPDGVFHAHPEFHVIKKESIGLIEAQGLFVLPGRLDDELGRVEKCITENKLTDDLSDFELVYDEAKAIYEKDGRRDVHKAMQKELGSICGRILHNTAVFKTDDLFLDFLKGIDIYE